VPGQVEDVSAPASASEPSAAVPRVRLSAWVGVIAAVQVAMLLAASTGYGYHRDELYFIVAGAHPAFGYPDQPALVPLVCWAMHQLAPGSLLVLRLPSAAAAATTTLLAALVAREVGGSRRAQMIAAACTASSGVAMAVGHFVTTTTFDILTTSVVGWLLIRALTRRSGPALLAAGVATGLGFEAKPQVGLVAVVAVISLLLVGPRWPLRSPWLAAGIGAAVALAAPYVIWQAAHGWPQLTVAANIGGSAEGGRAGFVPFQFLLVSPVLAPVWIAGLAMPFRRAAQRSLRFVSLTYAILALAYLVGDGKAYYLASVYPVLLGLGAIPTADWTLRVRARQKAAAGVPRRTRTAVLTTVIVVTVAISAFMALPVLPVTSLQGSVVMAVNPDQGETVGWPRFVTTVADAWQAIPADVRAHTVIFTANYGEAGAVDVLGHRYGLPQAYSGQNAFSEWGPPPPDATYALMLGTSGPTDVAPAFYGCTKLATIDNGVGLKNDEQGLPVLLCRTAVSWATLWPHLRRFD
jgi:hypothetical protein